MDCIIGIDIGTTNIKSVIITTSGELVNEFDQSHELHSPQTGYKEQDPEKILTSVITIIKKSLESLRADHVAKAISFSSAMHSVMAIDKNGNALTPLITWADTRAHKIAHDLKFTEQGKRIYEKTGTPVHAMSPLCKIAWIKKEQPHIFQNAAKFISAKEYIFFRLFNQLIIDHSIASATGLFNIETLDWDPEALEFAGITNSQLSDPVPITTSLTDLNEIYQTQIPLSNQTLFIIGGSDGCMANLGSFAVNNNEAAITIGTSGAVRRLSSKKIIDDQQQSFQYRLDESVYIIGGAINNGGIALQWFLGQFYDDNIGKKDISTIVEEIKKVPAGADGLVFLPYVFGERSPVWDASATGTFSGISSHHTKTHFLRAVIEGICFSLLQVMKMVEKNGPPINTVFASGGFIQSEIWVQTLTDILQKKITINTGVDASALGAAFVALKKLGFIDQWTDLKNYFNGRKEYWPDLNVTEIYQNNYQVYETLYPNLQKGKNS